MPRRPICVPGRGVTVTPHVARRLRPGTALRDPVLRDLQASLSKRAGYALEQIAGTRAVVYPDTPARSGFLTKPSTPRSTPCRVASCARR